MDTINPDKQKDKTLVEDYIQSILKSSARPYESSRKKSVSILSKIDTQEEREKKIKNDGLEQDQTLKKNTLIVLFIFLAIETVAIFVIAFLQGFNPCERYPFLCTPFLKYYHLETNYGKTRI